MIILPQQSKKTQVHSHLIEEIKATLTESEFVSRWSLIEGYHKVGELIEKSEESVSLTQIARDVNRSKRTLYRCVQFYKKYPDLSLLPEGKNTNWNKVIVKYLSDPKDPEPCEHEPITICKKCKLIMI